MAWAIIAVSPQRISAVERMLAYHNFENIVFRVRRRAVARGKVIWKRVPVFPGYVFVVARNAWRVIRAITGVIKFLRYGGPLVEATVADLRAQADAEGVLPWEEPEYESSRFRRGDLLRVQHKGYTVDGVFQKLISPDRASILLNWFGQNVPASCYESDLIEVPVREPPRRRRNGRKRVRGVV